MIVDGSAQVRSRLSRVLSRIKGIDVVALARDVPEAFEYLQAYHPDVVILDMQLPSGSSIDLLREVKTSHPQTLTIVLAEQPDPQQRQTCIETGADYFFDKSVASSTLVEICVRLSKVKHEPDPDAPQ